MVFTHRRNIVKVGDSLTISLPTSWLAQHGIEKGDTLTLTEKHDGSLSISPVKTDQPFTRRRQFEYKKGEME